MMAIGRPMVEDEQQQAGLEGFLSNTIAFKMRLNKVRLRHPGPSGSRSAWLGKPHVVYLWNRNDNEQACVNEGCADR